jgi:hypothetical protein
MVKLWINDSPEKPPPDKTWYWVTSLPEAVRTFMFLHRDITDISFDHDLGEDANGNPVDVLPLCYIIEQLASAQLIQKINWTINSENPVGQQRIYSAMSWADKHWNNERR